MTELVAKRVESSEACEIGRPFWSEFLRRFLQSASEHWNRSVKF